MNQQTIGVGTTRLPAQDLGALRESPHEQRLFHQEQPRRLAGPVASRAEHRLRQRAVSQAEVRAELVKGAVP